MRNIHCSMEHLSFSWPGGLEILVDLHGLFLLEGVVALCGANGCGKSTLLALMAGQLRPTSGKVLIRGGVAQLASQRLEGAFASPGELQRQRIGSLFRDDDSLLLLDEPTNHLDVDGLGELEQRLRRRRSPTVVVSHDRDFLDRIATRTWWLEDGAIVVTGGGFSEAWKAREARIFGRIAAREAHDEKVGVLKSSLQVARESARSADRHRTAGRRMKDANDRDATSMAADFKFRSAQTRIGQDMTRLGRALERLESQSVIEVKRDALRDFRFDWDADGASRRISLAAGFLATPDGCRILHGGLVLDGRSRVRLEGPNGSGKTTVMAAMAAQGRPGVVYLPQEPTQTEDMALLQGLRRDGSENLGRILTLSAVLGASGDALCATVSPSPGEARKLRLACMLAGSSWLLLLDEPTNHLDAASIQRLQDALERWPGGILLATHDKRLAMSVTTAVWRLEAGRIVQV